MPELFVPQRLDDAVSFLAEHRSTALPVAGGTDAVVDVRLGRVTPEWLVDLMSLEGLAEVDVAEDRIHLGALTRIRAIERHPDLVQRAPALVEAARVLGSVQIRNMATVGGNVCHATPSAEMPPALLVHEATAEVAGPEGRRSLALEQLFVGPGATALAPGELLTGLSLRAPLAHAGSCYLRQTVRWSMDLAGAAVAAFIETDGEKVTGARIALGAVAPVPLLATEAAAIVLGTDVGPEVTQRAGAEAAATCSPITDARGTAAYRRQVIAALVPRALRIAWLRATGNWPAGVLAPVNGVLSAEDS
ncbi:MAG: FAD binding domain-containing protein [Solirubrobacteraceae bacterium]